MGFAGTQVGNGIWLFFCMTCIGARPGWFEDSFSLKLGLPGSAGSVPTVLHDATDTGTDYIVKHLIVVGPRVPK